MKITFKGAVALIFCMLFVSVQQLCAQMHNPVHFQVQSQQKDGDILEVLFEATIDAGWHVYGTDVADGGPTCTTLTVEKCVGAKPIGTLQMRGDVHRAMDEMFGMEVSFMEKKALFVQQYKLTGGAYELSGYLTYGACDDEQCMPPTNVEFALKGEGPAAIAEVTEAVESAEKEDNPSSEENQRVDSTESTCRFDSIDVSISSALPEASPMVTDSSSLLKVFLMGLLGGLLALLTPCVWPIIPMTVSFFLKRTKDKTKGVRDAMTYGVSIVVIYLTLGLFVTLVFGANALNAMSTNATFNIFFFLMLVVFGASFLGGFELTLPGKLTTAIEKKSDATTGLLSIFLMAFTLSLVSFSCTGPIIGFLLVEVAQEGALMAPAIGMLGFALALALPFTFFALFPTLLKSVPRSGGWMNVVKVSLGFLELAFALKFFSVADLAYGWHLLDREVFLSLWIVLFALLGFYLLGIYRLPHDEDEYDDEGNVVVRPRISVPRFFLAVASLSFALYMVPGLWGAPCKAVSAFAPPMSTQDFNLAKDNTGVRFTDYDEGMRYAKEHGMPVMLDFTGYGCVNCRKMEAAVWTDPKVEQLMNEHYVLITLYVDDKTSLPEVQEVEENGSTTRLRTMGDKWSYLQRSRFAANAQPFYMLVDADGIPLSTGYSYNEDVEAFRQFLQSGLK